jgi:hypothetical protein
VVSAASVVLLVVGAGGRTLLRSCPEAAMVPAEGGCGVASGGGSAVWSAIPGAGVWMPGAGSRVPGAVGRVLLSAECRHLAREVVDLLQKCGVVGGWTNANERRLGCHVGDAVCTAGCGVQAALLLTGENGLYVGGWPVGPHGVQEVFWHVRCKAPEVSQELDGLRSPVSSSVSSWRMRCSL